MASLDRPNDPLSNAPLVGLHGEPDPRLVVLHGAASAHRLPVEISTCDNGRNFYVRLDRGRRAPSRVFHGTRAGDDGRTWFYGDGGEWIAESDDLQSVLVWLKGKHAEHTPDA
ncbi:hypothetical protein AB0L06_10220 [Spirillospora sp. NPDC052269]